MTGFVGKVLLKVGKYLIKTPRFIVLPKAFIESYAFIDVRNIALPTYAG
jgi:hypothetical protein